MKLNLINMTTTKNQIANFNRPYQRAVAINCEQIGDDNDYSCFLKTAVQALYEAGHKEIALKLFNTDPMLSEMQTLEQLAKIVEKWKQFDEEQKRSEELYWKSYRGD